MGDLYTILLKYFSVPFVYIIGITFLPERMLLYGNADPQNQY